MNREAAFISNWWKAKMKKKEIKYIKITSYHLNSNGLVERVNQNLKNYLHKFMEKRLDWINWLNKAEWAINNWAHWLQKLSLNEILIYINKEKLADYNSRFHKKVTQSREKYNIEIRVWLKTEKVIKSEVKVFLNKTYKGSFQIL